MIIKLAPILLTIIDTYLIWQISKDIKRFCAEPEQTNIGINEATITKDLEKDFKEAQSRRDKMIEQYRKWYEESDKWKEL